MSSYLLNNKSGGGGLSGGTVLWENPNPAATFGNNTLPITAENLSAFSFIGVKWKSRARYEDVYTTIWAADSVLSTADSTKSLQLSIGCGIGTYTYDRRIVLNATGLNIAQGVQVGGSGTSNEMVIPLQIIGY